MAKQKVPGVQTLTDSLDLTTIAVNSMGDSLGLNSVQLAGAWKAIQMLAAGVAEANAFQKQSLGINRTLSQVIGKNSAAIGSLVGGLYENAQSVLELQRAGFDKLNPKTAQLATFMRNTGQSTAGLLQQNRLLYNQGGLTENSLNALSENMMYNTAEYNISTTELIGAVNQLSGKMATFGMLGISGPLSEAVTDLTGRMGAQFGDSIGKFATLLAAPSTSTTLLQRLGLTEMARDIRLGKVDDNKLLEAIQQASKATLGFTGGTEGEIGEIFTKMLALAGGEGGLGQLGVSLGRADVAAEGPEKTVLQQMDELGTIFREIGEPIKIAFAGILDKLVPALKALAPFLRKLATYIFPILIARITWITMKIIWATTLATGRFIKSTFQSIVMTGMIGGLRGAIQANTMAQRAAGMGSIIGAIATVGVGIFALVKAQEAAGEIDERMLEMERNRDLEEQRKQAKDIPKTSSFLAMAKAISADAGIAMAFRPDVLDPLRRDEIMREVINYLDDIAHGVHRTPTADVKAILGFIR